MRLATCSSQQLRSFCLHCRRQPATAVALTADDGTAFSVCKHGQIAAVDVETGKWYGPASELCSSGKNAVCFATLAFQILLLKTEVCTAVNRTSFRASTVSKKQAAAAEAHDGPEWVKRAARAAGKAALLAAAVSDDGHLLAVGGGDRFVHVFDARSHELLKVSMQICQKSNIASDCPLICIGQLQVRTIVSCHPPHKSCPTTSEQQLQKLADAQAADDVAQSSCHAAQGQQLKLVHCITSSAVKHVTLFSALNCGGTFHDASSVPLTACRASRGTGMP